MRARTAVRLVLCALSLLTAPLAATAQQAGGTVTIGYLGNASPSLEADLVDAFREGLRQFGYVEGQNLVIRYQWAEGQQERHAVLAQELERDGVTGAIGRHIGKFDIADLYGPKRRNA